MKHFSKISPTFLHGKIEGESSEQVSFSVKAIISWLFKLTLSGLCLVYVLTELYAEKATISTLWSHILSLDLVFLIGIITLSSILLVANWGLEMVKWHMLIGKRLGTHWRSAIKGVLSGSTVGVFTPNRVGEFVGRVIALGPKQRVKATWLSVVNGVAQTVATLTFGLCSLTLFIDDLVGDQLGPVGLIVIAIVFILTWILSMGLYFNLPLVAATITQWKPIRRWRLKLEVVSEINRGQLHELYLMSLLRFMTFIGQYIIVFGFLMTEPNWQLIIGLSIISLFSNTILSFLPIPDVLLRNAVALSYFGLFDFDLSLVSIAVFLVWLINVAFPAMIGALILLTYRIFKQV